MESKEYFEKVMQDYNQHRNGRSLRKYCKDEAIDYDWVIKFKKTYPVRSTEKEEPAEGFVPLSVTDEPAPSLEYILKMFSPGLCMESMLMTHSFHVVMSLVTRRGRMPHSIKKQ